MLYNFKLGNNATKPTKSICMKSEGAVDHNTITRWCKKLDKQTRSGWPKTVNSKTKEANPAHSTRRVSDKF